MRSLSSTEETVSVDCGGTKEKKKKDKDCKIEFSWVARPSKCVTNTVVNVLKSELECLLD